jgi:hypothetical protein
MATHWGAGLIRWRPHVERNGRSQPLNHLHPFRFEHRLANAAGELIVTVHVGFGLHCFTRSVVKGAEPVEPYSDERETREFDAVRYELSKKLPAIVRTLATRPCAFGRHDNYVSVDLVGTSGEPVRYAIFFNVKRWEKMGPSALLLIVQSAYPLTGGKAAPLRGRIGFDTLLRHALRGSRPKAPR